MQNNSIIGFQEEIMIRTIEEIRRLKMEGKRKWGKDLLEFLKPYFDAGRTYEEIIIILSSEYNIDLDLNEFKNLKFRYRKIYDPPEQKILKTAEITPNYKKANLKNELIKEENKIVQNQESEKSEIEKSFEEIFGDDNILERQKREREELFRTNSKGAKW